MRDKTLELALDAPSLTEEEIEEIVNKHVAEEFGLLTTHLEVQEKLLDCFLGFMKGEEDVRHNQET